MFETVKRKDFFMGLLTFFKETETVIFKKIRWKNNTKMAVVPDLIPKYKRVFAS